MIPQLKLLVVAVLALLIAAPSFAAPKRSTVRKPVAGKNYFKGVINRRALNDKAVKVRKTFDVNVKHLERPKALAKGRKLVPGKDKTKRRYVNNSRTSKVLKVVKIKAPLKKDRNSSKKVSK